MNKLDIYVKYEYYDVVFSLNIRISRKKIRSFHPYHYNISTNDTLRSLFIFHCFVLLYDPQKDIRRKKISEDLKKFEKM